MLFRTTVNSTKLLFLYLLIQLPSPKIKIPQNSNVNELNSNVNDLNNRLTASGKSFHFGITADGEYGYHKEVDGADTVIPFKTKGNYGVTKLLSYPGYTKINSIIADRDYIAVIFMFTSPNNAVTWKNNSLCSSGTLLVNQWLLHDQCGINAGANYLGVKIYKDVPKGANIVVQMGTVYGIYES